MGGSCLDEIWLSHRILASAREAIAVVSAYSSKRRATNAFQSIFLITLISALSLSWMWTIYFDSISCPGRWNFSRLMVSFNAS